MEPLYPQNILERRYPILREQREKQEREELAEKRRLNDGFSQIVEEIERALHENQPRPEGAIGSNLNTLA